MRKAFFSILAALTASTALAQSQPAVRRGTPQADDPGMVVRQVGTVNVNCTSGCGSGSGGGWTPDGGNIGFVNQGIAADGGTSWAANITHVGGNAVTTTIPVSASSLPLPTGAATEATLSTRVADSTITGRLPAGAALTDNFANPTTTQVGTMNMWWDGATWDRAAGTSTDGLLVNLGANNDVTVTGTVNAAQSGTWNINNVSGTVSLPTGASTSALQTTGNNSLANIDADLPAPAALADATANPTVSGIGSFLQGYNGTTWDRLRSSTANGLLVDVSRIQAALPAGTAYIGKTRLTDGTLDMSLLNAAPGSDTGQVSVPVRIISSLAGGAGGTSSSYGAAFPATGTAGGYSDGTNMQGARVFDADTGAGNQYVLGASLRVSASGGSTEAAAGAGTTSTSTLRVVLPTDQTVIPVSDNGTTLTVDGTGSDNSANSTAKVPVLAARANAAAPSWTEGNQAPLSTDLAGALRITGTVTANAGSGTQSTNIAQYGGVAVSAANAVHVQPGTGATFTVAGNKSQNTATPGSTNVGALVAQVGAADPSWTDTNQTTLSVDTAGFLRSRTGILVGATMRTMEGYDADTGAGSNYLPGVLLRFSASGGSVEAAAGAGATTSGTQRVVLPTDQSAIPVTQSGSWSLAANQSVNLAQVGGTSTVTGGVAGSQGIGGLSASGAAKSGNPVQIGGVFNTTQPTVSTGQTVEAQMTARGAQIVATGVDTFTATVTQATASNLRTQTASEGATAAAVPASASYTGFLNSAGNLVGARTFDADTSGSTQEVLGVQLIGGQFGGGSPVAGENVPINGTGSVGIVTNPIKKFATNPSTTSITCANTATAISSSPLANRFSQCFLNNGANTIYIGASGVTTANGFPLAVGASFCDDSGSQSYYCIVASGTENLRLLEN